MQRDENDYTIIGYHGRTIKIPGVSVGTVIDKNRDGLFSQNKPETKRKNDWFDNHLQSQNQWLATSLLIM